MYKSVQKYEDIVDELNIEINKIQQKWKISTQSRQELLDGVLFARVRDGFASTIKLIISDFHLESAILTRSTVEAFLVFSGHIADRDKAYEYLLKQEKYNKKKFINKTLNNGKYKSFYNVIKAYDKSELAGDEYISAERWARLGGQIEHYDYSYTFMSVYTHVNLESLEKRLNKDGKKINGFRQLQNNYDLDLILTTIIDIMIQSIKFLKTKYDVLDEIKIEELEEKFNRIANCSEY